MMNYPGHFGFWQQPGSSSNGGSNSLLASTLSSSAAYDTVSVNNSNGNVMDSGGMRQLFTSAFEPTSAHLQQQMRNSMNHNHKNPSIHGGLDSLIMQQMPPAMGGFHHQQQQQHPSTTDLSNNNNNSGRTTSVINGGGFNNNGMVVNSAGSTTSLGPPPFSAATVPQQYPPPLVSNFIGGNPFGGGSSATNPIPLQHSSASSSSTLMPLVTAAAVLSQQQQQQQHSSSTMMSGGGPIMVPISRATNNATTLPPTSLLELRNSVIMPNTAAVAGPAGITAASMIAAAAVNSIGQTFRHPAPATDSLLPNNNHIHQQKPSSSSLGSHDNSLANSLESGGQQLRLEKGFGAIFNNLQQHLNTNNHSNNKNNMNNNNTNYANNNVAPAGGLIVAKIPTEAQLNSQQGGGGLESLHSSALQADCAVCEMAASNGLHFGARTCAACAAFFRRSVSDSKRYICKRSQRCTVRPAKEAQGYRKMCRSCRFQKCRDVGMLAENVQNKRQRREFYSSESSSLVDHADSNSSSNKTCQQQQHQLMTRINSDGSFGSSSQPTPIPTQNQNQFASAMHSSMQQQQHSTVGGSSQSHLNLLQNSDGIKQQQDSKRQESVANDLMFYTVKHELAKHEQQQQSPSTNGIALGQLLANIGTINSSAFPFHHHHHHQQQQQHEAIAVNQHSNNHHQNHNHQQQQLMSSIHQQMGRTNTHDPAAADRKMSTMSQLFISAAPFAVGQSNKPPQIDIMPHLQQQQQQQQNPSASFFYPQGTTTSAVGVCWPSSSSLTSSLIGGGGQDA